MPGQRVGQCREPGLRPQPRSARSAAAWSAGRRFLSDSPRWAAHLLRRDTVAILCPVAHRASRRLADMRGGHVRARLVPYLPQLGIVLVYLLALLLALALGVALGIFDAPMFDL